ncbi:hypothetical protein I79_018742 [Cricetulus griseus]|uniref:Uncharacterized protein n=1 Tax=Cricetulus griseus TaxID=10029 RepID=G3I5J3_CRIGR|nr:hypothetical protein I79_018742 [Cricetulus griseus]
MEARAYGGMLFHGFSPRITSIGVAALTMGWAFPYQELRRYPTDLTTVQSCGGNLSIGTPSSPMTLVCVKLTANNLPAQYVCIKSHAQSTESI